MKVATTLEAVTLIFMLVGVVLVAGFADWKHAVGCLGIACLASVWRWDHS